MTQSELNDLVAEKTGESRRTIRRRGFSIMTPLALCEPDDNDAQPQMVDWDRIDRERLQAA